MARLEGEPFDSARELFKPRCKDGAVRCQAFAKSKLQELRDKYGEDLTGVEPIDLAKAQCGAHARGGSSVCFHHGAGSITKPGGRPLQHAGYSSFLPINLVGRYEDALADPELLQLRQEIAVIISLASDALEQYRDYAPDKNELGDALTSLGQALKADDLAEAKKEYLRLYEIFKAGKGKDVALRQISNLIELRRKLSASEVRRLEALNQMLTVQQAMAFQAAVLHVITEALKEIEMLKCSHCGKVLEDSYELAQIRFRLADRFRQLSTKTRRTVGET